MLLLLLLSVAVGGQMTPVQFAAVAQARMHQLMERLVLLIRLWGRHASASLHHWGVPLVVHHCGVGHWLLCLSRVRL